jgi:23S rRNA pseudouridine2605 synthase
MTEKPTPAKPRRAIRPAAPGGSDAKEAHASAGERIAKVLSRAGIASRREAERLIEAGEVKVNGKLVTSPALNVTARDKITVSGQPVGAPEPARLWLYYKPEGLVTSASDEKGRDTVFDHLPEDMPRVMSVGRLDLNSEGLLLLTNDGALKRKLELPSTGWLRKYRVRVKGNPTDPELDPLRKGITVEGERFQPMDVVLDRHQGANAWLTVGLREGRNREIRRAMSAIGVTVNRLIRISYGPFRLNEMKPGEVEEVRARVLKEQLGSLLPGAAEPDAPAATRARPASSGARKGVVTSSAKAAARPERAPRSGDEPGTVRSAKGRAGLKTLSETWARATKSAPKAGESVGSSGPTRRSGRTNPARPRPPKTRG